MEKDIKSVKEKVKGLMVALITKTVREIHKRTEIIYPLPAKEVKYKSRTNRWIESDKSDQQEYREDQSF